MKHIKGENFGQLHWPLQPANDTELSSKKKL